jgi:hypothetical protein
MVYICVVMHGYDVQLCHKERNLTFTIDMLNSFSITIIIENDNYSYNIFIYK